MKATLIASFFCVFAIFSLSAFAAPSVTTLTCTMKTIPGQTFNFRMKDLGKAKMTFVAEESDEYLVFKTKSKNEDLNQIVDTLNGQGGDLRIKNDRIVFFGDSAGIDFVYLELFKNSGYQKGFVRTEFNFGEVKQYSPVSCVLK